MPVGRPRVLRAQRVSLAAVVAERGGMAYEDVAALVGITRQAVTNVEKRALAKLARCGEAASLYEESGS